jgi:three-Cys-motif partner protein
VSPGKHDRWPELLESVRSNDALPTRKSGPWTADKLWFWHRYIEVTTTAMVGNPNWPGGVIYVDLFAGSGVCTIDPGGQRVPGSALIAAQARKPFSKILLAEKKPELASACRVRVGRTPAARRCRVFEGDCNALINEIASEIPDRALTLAFADPAGLDIELETIRILSHRRNVDLLILLADAMDAARNRGIYTEQDSKMDRFLGQSSPWRERLRDMRGAEWRAALRDLYEQELRRLGYPHFARRTITGDNRPLYGLVFASKSDRGLDFWHKAARGHRSGQRELFCY